MLQRNQALHPVGLSHSIKMDALGKKGNWGKVNSSRAHRFPPIYVSRSQEHNWIARGSIVKTE
jgi:hypothetical protein